MSWVAKCGLLAFGGLWPLLILVFDEIPLWTAISSRGSFFGPLVLLLALCLLIGASRASLLSGLLAGAAAASLSGPFFSFGLSGAYAYAIAAVLAACALFIRPLGVSVWAAPIAAASQGVALILLARRQFGVGNAVVEADYAIFWPMILVWVVGGAASGRSCQKNLA